MKRTIIAGTIVLLAAMLLSVAMLRADAVTEPARIVITTDGTHTQVETSGGDVGYPGPASVELEYDAHGLVVVTRARVFAVFDHVARLPVVMAP